MAVFHQEWLASLKPFDSSDIAYDVILVDPPYEVNNSDITLKRLYNADFSEALYQSMQERKLYTTSSASVLELAEELFCHSPRRCIEYAYFVDATGKDMDAIIAMAKSASRSDPDVCIIQIDANLQGDKALTEHVLFQQWLEATGIPIALISVS